MPFPLPGSSSAVVLGIEPPDKFPLCIIVIMLQIVRSRLMMIRAKVQDYKILLINGTAMNMEPTRSATFLRLGR